MKQLMVDVKEFVPDFCKSVITVLIQLMIIHYGIVFVGLLFQEFGPYFRPAMEFLFK